MNKCRARRAQRTHTVPDFLLFNAQLFVKTASKCIEQRKFCEHGILNELLLKRNISVCE